MFYVLQFVSFSNSLDNLITCEYITTITWITNNQDHLYDKPTCFMRDETKIDSHDFTITSEQGRSVFGLDFESNKKISFLPVNVHKDFPNLVGINASDCSIKSISKDNFRDLRELKFLYLFDNEIETVSPDAFEDLISLEELDLGN